MPWTGGAISCRERGRSAVSNYLEPGHWISRHEIQVMGPVEVNVVVVENWEKAGGRARPGLKLRRMERVA